MKLRRSYRWRMFGLIVVLITVSIAVMLFTLFTLFQSVAYQNQYMLKSYVDNQALLFERMLYDQPDWQIEDSLTVLSRVYEQFERNTLPLSGSNGDFQVVVRSDEEIHWLLPSGDVMTQPMYEMTDEVVLASLNGAQGVLRFDDPAEETYVTVFTGLPDWNVGFIFTISLEAMRTPFINAAIKAVLAAVILTSIGGWVFYLLSRPIIVNLEENELKYRTLFDNANEGVLLLGPTIVECNDRAAAIFETPKWHLIGSELSTFNDANRVVINFNYYLAAAKKGEAQYFIWQAKSANGQRIDLEIMMRQIELDEEDLILATLVDITDRRKAERELAQAEQAIRDSRDHLAHVARLNTMGEMAAGIAHEINQPLSAISTYAQASDTLLDAERINKDMLSEALGEISKQSQRAGEVIKRLRDFVNKTGTQVNCMAPSELVTESINLAMVDARKYDIPLVKEIANNLPMVNVDAVQIQQVLLNLIRNALEEMSAVDKDDRVLRIAVEAIKSGIVIKVIDTGPGIPVDVLPRLFHPFFTTKETGMGIGLSISQSIISSHKGTLTAYNNEIKGATFEVFLPSLDKQDK